MLPHPERQRTAQQTVIARSEATKQSRASAAPLTVPNIIEIAASLCSSQ
jgi:hypothetical protein